jgi:AraC family transcriptional regulator, regulatory protein of adaptative response / methylphosphotriester-DNA alkyltransferase methyltransferase
MNDEIFASVYETILRRDTRYDGQYYVAIKTTGIFCRPSCRSRTPRPENVIVCSSIEEAVQKGFRACKRCRPDNPDPHGPDAGLAQAVVELIQQRYRENLTLAEMAAACKISPYHLQRVFKRMTGTTPAKQLLQTRMEEAKRYLDQKELAIADIATAVGFRSISHFTVAFKKMFGSTPNEYKEDAKS